MEWEYRKELNHVYLILPGEDKESADYQECMLQKNKIEGFLSFHIKYVDNKKKYCYEISSKKPLRYVYSVRKMKYEEFVRLLYAVEAVIREAEKYLLDSSRLLLTADMLYWDLNEEKIWMIYYPVAVSERENLYRAGEDYLELIDYEDEKVVEAAHYFYEKSQEENFCWDSIISYIEQRELSETETEAVTKQEALPVQEDIDTEKTMVLQEKPFFPVAETVKERNRLLLGTAAMITAIAAAGTFLWMHFIFTPIEMTIGAFVLAVAVAAVLVYTGSRLKKWQVEQEREYEESKTAYEQIHTVDTVQKEVLRKREKEAEETKEEETKDQSAEEYYGETVCLSMVEDEEERRLEGRVRGKEVLIFLDSMPFLIGKLQDRVSYTLADTSVSRIHAVFKEENGKLLLSDLQSKNGTFKNEIRLEAGEALEVRPGDEIRFGKLKFTYH